MNNDKWKLLNKNKKNIRNNWFVFNQSNLFLIISMRYKFKFLYLIKLDFNIIFSFQSGFSFLKKLIIHLIFIFSKLIYNFLKIKRIINIISNFLKFQNLKNLHDYFFGFISENLILILTLLEILIIIFQNPFIFFIY